MRTRVIFALGSAASARGSRMAQAAGATARDLRNDLRFIESAYYISARGERLHANLLKAPMFGRCDVSRAHVFSDGFWKLGVLKFFNIRTTTPSRSSP